MDLYDQVLLAEYADLRSEIHQRVGFQMITVGANVVLLAALVPVASALLDSAGWLLLFFPIMFAMVGWKYYTQDVFISRAARYIHTELRPRIERRINEGTRSLDSLSVLGWERFLASDTSRPGIASLSPIFRYTMNVGPGVVSLVVAVSWVATTNLTLGYLIVAVSIIAVDVALLTFLAYVGTVIAAQYDDVTRSEA